MQKQQGDICTYHALLAAVIDRAIEDLKGMGPQCSKSDIDRAMYFINSDYCEWFCLELCICYEAVREKASALYQKFLYSDFPGLYGSGYYKQPDMPV
jgi:hypothetical protein